MKTSLSLAVLIVLTPSAIAQGKISGCLLTPGGILYNVRVADTPSAACRPQDTTIMWNVSGPQVFEFVGLSNTSHNGGEGVLNYNTACANAFSGSRMCTTEEVLETISPPLATGNSWVRPVFVPHQLSGQTLDISGAGASNLGNRSCLGWSSSAPIQFGTVLQQPGRILTATCDSTIPVACCAPATE